MFALHHTVHCYTLDKGYLTDLQKELSARSVVDLTTEEGVLRSRSEISKLTSGEIVELSRQGIISLDDYGYDGEGKPRQLELF
jgi:hypothetical protein